MWRKKYFKCTQQLWIWTLEAKVKYYSRSKGHKSATISADIWIHLLLYACVMMVGYLINMQLWIHHACLWKYVPSLVFSLRLSTNYLSVCLLFYLYCFISTLVLPVPCDEFRYFYISFGSDLSTFLTIWLCWHYPVQFYWKTTIPFEKLVAILLLLFI